MDKEYIISEIKHTDDANDGKALGKQRFFIETEIKEIDWCGKFWTKWSDAILVLLKV